MSIHILCHNVARFIKHSLSSKIRNFQTHNNQRTRISGTRKWGERGSDKKLMWLAFLPSFNTNKTCTKFYKLVACIQTCNKFYKLVACIQTCNKFYKLVAWIQTCNKFYKLVSCIQTHLFALRCFCVFKCIILCLLTIFIQL